MNADLYAIWTNLSACREKIEKLEERVEELEGIVKELGEDQLGIEIRLEEK